MDPAFFDTLYADSDDPWQLAARWYEQRKYALTLAALRRPRYRNAFEPGCSVGVLTNLLAERCDRLLAVDAHPRAVELAAARVALAPHVRVRQQRLPEWPAGPFDLIVLSEIGYYFTADALEPVIASAVSTLEPSGDLVAVHWRHPVPEHQLAADTVHKIIAAHPELEPTARHEEEDFLLEVHTRTPPAVRSVADLEGLLP